MKNEWIDRSKKNGGLTPDEAKQAWIKEIIEHTKLMQELLDRVKPEAVEISPVRPGGSIVGGSHWVSISPVEGHQ